MLKQETKTYLINNRFQRAINDDLTALQSFHMVVRSINRRAQNLKVLGRERGFYTDILWKHESLIIKKNYHKMGI